MSKGGNSNMFDILLLGINNVEVTIHPRDTCCFAFNLDINITQNLCRSPNMTWQIQCGWMLLKSV